MHGGRRRRFSASGPVTRLGGRALRGKVAHSCAETSLVPTRKRPPFRRRKGALTCTNPSKEVRPGGSPKRARCRLVRNTAQREPRGKPCRPSSLSACRPSSRPSGPSSPPGSADGGSPRVVTRTTARTGEVMRYGPGAPRHLTSRVRLCDGRRVPARGRRGSSRCRRPSHTRSRARRCRRRGR